VKELSKKWGEYEGKKVGAGEGEGRKAGGLA
jgi:hypothetical protein